MCELVCTPNSGLSGENTTKAFLIVERCAKSLNINPRSIIVTTLYKRDWLFGTPIEYFIEEHDKKSLAGSLENAIRKAIKAELGISVCACVLMEGYAYD